MIKFRHFNPLAYPVLINIRHKVVLKHCPEISKFSEKIVHHNKLILKLFTEEIVGPIQ